MVLSLLIEIFSKEKIMKKSSFIANILILIAMLAILFIGNTSWAEEHTYEEKEKAKYEEELKEHLNKYATKDTKLELREIVELENVLSHMKRGELLRLVDENKLKIDCQKRNEHI